MIFPVEPIDFPDLTDETSPSGVRHYVTPEGNRYPSITTIIGAMSDKTALYEWRERIGYEEADKKSAQARKRGTAVHKCFEDYINNCLNKAEHVPLIYELFLKGKEALDNNVTKVFNQEFCVYSDRLRTAGRCDLFAEWNGVPAIIDFKGSDYEKQLDWIHGYLKQECCYALAIGEMKKIKVKKLVTIIVCENAPKPQIIEQDTKDWVEETVSMFKGFHKRYPEY